MESEGTISTHCVFAGIRNVSPCFISVLYPLLSVKVARPSIHIRIEKESFLATSLFIGWVKSNKLVVKYLHETKGVSSFDFN